MRAKFSYALCLAGVMLAPVPALAGKIYGLVIGVDDYQYISDLHGAENDARDIADALAGLEADVTMLLNGAATRDAVLSTWRQMAKDLGPEDQLIVSYAGHGSHEPEHHIGSEDDGRDETLLLSGFSPYGPAAAERIRDDEIAELLALSGEGQVIFIADACHSGTVSRTLVPSLGYRYVAVDGITKDPLPPPPPPKAREADKANAALFLAAGDDSEKTPEFLIDGKPRGALSYSFAASLRGGAADENGDRILTKGEIETFVRKRVRTVSQGVQRPQVSPAGGSDAVLFALSDDTDKRPTSIPVLSRNFNDLPRVSIFVTGEFATPDGATIVATPEDADLRVDLNTGQVTSMVGDVVRQLPRRNTAAMGRGLQQSIDKLRVARAMELLSGSLDVRFTQGDRLYRDGDTVTVQVQGRREPHLVLMNIASDGVLNFLYPVSRLGDPLKLDATDRLNLPLRVSAPFGADHIVAIETGASTSGLIDVLARFDGSRDIRGFWQTFRQTVTQEAKIAIFPFHTRGGQDG